MISPTILVNKLAREPITGRTVQKLHCLKYRTYRALRKDLKNQLEASCEDEIQVARSRRGEGGEWFEVWTLQDGEPVMLREGWQ